MSAATDPWAGQSKSMSTAPGDETGEILIQSAGTPDSGTAVASHPGPSAPILGRLLILSNCIYNNSNKIQHHRN